LSSRALKRAADMVRAGGVLLPESCPKCAVPLVKFKGKVLCPACGAEVKIVRGAGEEVEALLESALNEVTAWAAERIQELVTEARGGMPDEEAVEKIKRYIELIEAVRSARFSK
jgi:uncharacterized Zn finger protein (UPF0148 family)